MATQTLIAQWLVLDLAGAELEPHQQEGLDAWAGAKAGRARFVADLRNPRWQTEEWKEYPAVDLLAAWAALQARIAAMPGVRPLPDLRPEELGRSPMSRLARIRRWKGTPWLSAACVVAFVVGIVLVRKGKEASLVADAVEEPFGSTSLSWSGGPHLILGDLNWGWIFQYAGWAIISPEPKKTFLSRDSVDKHSTPVDSSRLSISTAAGGTHSVVLPDGSQVDLNAVSHLQIPPSYGVVNREMDLEGEGFFVVRPTIWNFYQQNGPFVVHAYGRLTITAWGTEFNVKAYPNDSTLRTSLLSGSVELQYGDHVYVLKPGDTYVLRHDGTDTVMRQVNRRIAWTDGAFNFDETPLDEMLNELARWYGVNIVYRQRPAGKTFTLFVYRDEPLSSVLTRLNKTKTVQFTFDPKTNSIEVSESH